jgi:pyridoxine/pyridoxamine 5'-phosphate oxidase
VLLKALVPMERRAFYQLRERKRYNLKILYKASFYWIELTDTWIGAKGRKTSRRIANLFSSRPVGSQLSAWRRQSQVVDGRRVLMRG